MTQLLKPGLFIYECLRLLFLISALAAATDGLKNPLLVFTASNALFPLIALFLLLNISRYRDYLPLYFAGKCISLFSVAGWVIISKQETIIWALMNSSRLLFTPRIFTGILSCGDLFSVAAALLIYREIQLTKITDTKTNGNGEQLCE